MSWFFPQTSYAGSVPVDVAPTAYLVPTLFFVVLLLALTIAYLPSGPSRLQRSLALLCVLVCTFGILLTIFSLPLNAGVSLFIFLGIFGVLHQLGRFDAAD